MKMSRRCTTESCLIGANKRSFNLDLPIANILYSPKRDWKAATQGKNRIASSRKIDVDWKEFNQDQYLFSHSTIVASVDTESDGHTIKAPCDELVNNNGNAWTNPVLMASFKSFCGAENYYEHVQVPALSKGKILDAVLRPVKYAGNNDGKKKASNADVLFCDILVATHRKHGDLVKRIEAGELTTMSMGCLANWVTCSKCGAELTDSDKNCEHIDRELLSYYTDKDGQKRIVAELCGRTFLNNKGERIGDPDSVKFIEASWVENPAFKGAVINHYISEIPKSAAKVLNYPTHQLQACVDDLFKMRVADTNGMMVLRVAMEELRRRRWEDMTNRVASKWI
jgi:hypothetical protein